MTTQELMDGLVFTTLFEEVCQKFNISVPVLGNNSSVDGTNVTAGSALQPSMEPSTGTAARALTAWCMFWALGGALCITMLATYA